MLKVVLKKAWKLYGDFVTLEWLLRWTGNNPDLQLSIVLLVGSLPFGYIGWYYLQPNHVEHNRAGILLTRGQTVFSGYLSLAIGVALVFFALVLIYIGIPRDDEEDGL